MANLSATLSAAGITAPTYPEILATLQSEYYNIFGSDAYINPDSQDGQLLAIFAAAIHDSNNATIQAYNNFSPTFAQGNNLSSLVKINGIARLVSSNSTAPVLISGSTGTIITNGVVSDSNGNLWNLPATVTIPVSGSITVLATSQVTGSIPAVSGSINVIHTPTLGWQTVVSTADATLGAPVETDAALRIRQSNSTSFPSTSVLSAVSAAIANVSGVIKSMVYENNTGTTDTNGIPGHSISVVVSGGDPVVVAQTIANRKSPGTGTYGTTSEVVSVGNTNITINFYQATNEVLTATINITAKPGYNNDIGNGIKQSLYNFIQLQQIGQTIEFTQALAACVGPTYKLESIGFTVNGGAVQTDVDIAIPFNGLPSLALGAITLVVT